MSLQEEILDAVIDGVIGNNGTITRQEVMQYFHQYSRNYTGGILSKSEIDRDHTGLFWLSSYLKQFNFAGDVPIQTIALVISVLILVVFGISFMIEKTIDLFLGLLSLGPVVFIVAAVALIQGLLTGLHITDHNGLLNLLRG